MVATKQYLGLAIALGLVFWIFNPAVAVFVGIAFAMVCKPEPSFITKKASSYPLQIGIVILGATIQFKLVQDVAVSYFPWISLFVFSTLLLGWLFYKLLKLEKNQAILLTVGSAICGGTAMAAIAPIIKASSKDLMITLTIIFILNAVAIAAFPIIGEFLQLSAVEFGAWVSLAVHDTSSVIGAALAFEAEAVKTAATLKLGRTLWLIPLVFFAGIFFNGNASKKGLQVPLFIIFLIAALLLQFIVDLSPQVIAALELASKLFLIFGLFCIGSQANLTDFSGISLKPIFFSLVLWFCAIGGSLAILFYSGF